jgi:N utilization substance protein B
MSSTPARSRSRSAARLAAVQALYQHEMEGTPLPRLLKEFHDHRLGATIEDETYHQAEHDFFDDIVVGAEARRGEIDALIGHRLAEGWTLERLDRPMRAILRAGAYELIARADVPADEGVGRRKNRVLSAESWVRSRLLRFGVCDRSRGHRRVHSPCPDRSRSLKEPNPRQGA